MLVIGISGSPRVNGNTNLLLDAVLEGSRSENAEVKKFYLANSVHSGCLGCGRCDTAGSCHIKDDISEIYDCIKEADALVLASPIYFENISSWMKTFVDRGQFLWSKNLDVDNSKAGLFISVAARLSTDFACAEKTIRIFFKTLGFQQSKSLLFPGFEEPGSILDAPFALDESRAAGRKLVVERLH
ncbi:flavodoxin family protein [Candidatus Methanomassiliicoccus intestinalis]|uniref:flavodoxin family protein n=1 Tax=Candidatus Methanomassiliicoccus intestinalis TaxID=1406512 RepID=UPI0037DC0CB0